MYDTKQATTNSPSCIQAIGEDERTGEVRDGSPEEDSPNPVSATNARGAVLTTTLVVDRLPATPSTLGQALRRNPLPTHRVSAGIHHQALKLIAKRVPFVSHPKRKANR